MATPRGVWLWAGGALWLLLVVGGLATLSSYKSSAGEAASAPVQWPASSAVTRAPQRATLLMFAHPFCPCTRASVAELAKLMARSTDTLDAHVLFVRPAGSSGQWEESDLWDSARAIPGVTAQLDLEAREADRFGSLTSGQVLLYSSAGELLFQGGITPGRGHEGDNPGVERVLSLARGAETPLHDSPVFGCELHDPK